MAEQKRTAGRPKGAKNVRTLAAEAITQDSLDKALASIDDETQREAMSKLLAKKKGTRAHAPFPEKPESEDVQPPPAPTPTEATTPSEASTAVPSDESSESSEELPSPPPPKKRKTKAPPPKEQKKTPAQQLQQPEEKLPRRVRTTRPAAKQRATKSEGARGVLSSAPASHPTTTGLGQAPYNYLAVLRRGLEEMGIERQRRQQTQYDAFFQRMR